MTAFDFGAWMQKRAVGPYRQARPTPPAPPPQFNFGHARQNLAKYDSNYNSDMTSRQVWDRTVELGTIQPGTKKLSPFQHVMKREYRGRMPETPVFAGPGKPGFKPPVAAAPQPRPGVPVAQGRPPAGGVPPMPNPRQFGRQLGGQARFPGWQQGNPLPPKTILADDGFPITKDPNLTRIEAMQ